MKSNQKTGHLIIVNGGSSVGKSTLIKAFQNYAYKKGLDYWRFGTDCAFWMMQEAVLKPDMSKINSVDKAYFHIEETLKDGEPYPIFHGGPKFFDFIRARYQATKAYLDLGYNVIADEVVWSDEYLKIFVEECQQYPTYLVKTYVSPNTAKQREIKRGDRPNNLCISSAEYAHKNMHYDFELNLDHLTPEQSALQLYNGLSSTPSPTAIYKLLAKT